MWLVWLPYLSQIVVKHPQPRNYKAVRLALFPGELSQGVGVVGAVVQHYGFKVETARCVWTARVHLLRKEEMLPTSAHCVDGGGLLLGVFFLGIVLLCRGKLQKATRITNDR